MKNIKLLQTIIQENGLNQKTQRAEMFTTYCTFFMVWYAIVMLSYAIFKKIEMSFWDLYPPLGSVNNVRNKNVILIKYKIYQSGLNEGS